MDTINIGGARHELECYDNGGVTADRYTVVYLSLPEPGEGYFSCRGMSYDPFHPLGVGMFGSAMPGEHLGQPIHFTQLPPQCQRLVVADLMPEQ